MKDKINFWITILFFVFMGVNAYSDDEHKLAFGSKIAGYDGLIWEEMPVKDHPEYVLLVVRDYEKKGSKVYCVLAFLTSIQKKEGYIVASLDVKGEDIDRNIVFDMPCIYNKIHHAVGIMNLNKSKNGIVVPLVAWSVDVDKKSFVSIDPQSVSCDVSG